MGSRYGSRMSKPSSKPATSVVVPVQVKSEAGESEIITSSSSKKRKDISPSTDQVWNEDDEAKSCPRCHRNLLLMTIKRYPGASEKETVKECSACSSLDKEIEIAVNGIKASNDDRRRPFAKAATIPKIGHDLSPSVGVWKGINLEQSEKDMLEAVNERYPKTFQRVKIRSKPHWRTILGELHVFIKRFLDSSVDALAEDEITSLEEDLDDFESLGFDLSWARERLEMVKNMKFGNDPLRLQLVADEECLKVATARLEKARLDYNKAVDNRTKTVNEVAQKFGVTYDGVLSGNLGFGMLPGH